MSSDALDRRAWRTHLFVCQGEQPPNAASQSFHHVQPQSLNQHHVGEVLRDQKAARLTLAQFVHHPLHQPAQRRLIRCVLNMDNRRRHSQQDAGIAGKNEAAADKKKIPARSRRSLALTAP